MYEVRYFEGTKNSICFWLFRADYNYYMHRLFIHLYVPRISQIFLSSTITAFPQLTQAIFTSFVALTLIPQRGQIYFLVLDGLRIGVGLSVGIWCVPVPGIWNTVASFRLIRMSVRSLSRTNCRSSSAGAVCDQPYFGLWVKSNPRDSAARLNRWLW